VIERELGRAALVGKFRAELPRLREATDAEFNARRSEEERKLRDGIESDRSHRGLLNMAVFPFTRRRSRPEASLVGSTGFEFVRGSPLDELGVRNFDFLLFRPGDGNRQASAICGEVKSAVPRPAGLVKEIKEKAKVAQQNLDYVRRSYLQIGVKDPVGHEFVAMVNSADALSVVNAVVEDGGGIIVWHGVSVGPSVLRLADPPRRFPRRHTMLHWSKALNDALSGFPTNRRCFEVWPNSHPVSRMKSLVSSANPSEDSYVLRKGVLEQNLRQVDFFYMNDVEVQQEVDSILALGTKVGFIQPATLVGEFSFALKTRNPASLEKDLENRWVSYTLTEKHASMLEEKVQELRGRLLAEKAKHPELHAFEDKDGFATGFHHFPLVPALSEAELADFKTPYFGH